MRNWSEVCFAFEAAALDGLIENLKKARAAAFPVPLKDLCPSSSMLLRYLKRHHNVTPIKAREELGIEHLPRRIKDLKEHGHVIRTEYHKGFYGKRYAKYVLVSSPVATPSGAHFYDEGDLV